MRLYCYILSLVFSITGFIQHGFSQNKKLEVFEGPYSINDTLNGTASFSYYLNEDDIKIMEGVFKFTQRSRDTSGKFKQYTYWGNYEDGLKKGTWTYENHTYDIAISEVSEQLETDLSIGGIQTRLRAHYEKGKAQGDWVYEEFLVSKDHTKKVLSTMNMSFVEGRMVGKFNYAGQINGEPASIRGVFDDQHFFDGEWKLEYTVDAIPYDETRIYDNGFLTHITVLSDTKVLYNHAFTGVKEKIKQGKDTTQNEGFYIDDRYFGFLFDDGFLQTSPQISSQVKGNKILEQVTGKLFNQEIGGLQLSGLLYVEPGATRRFHYIHSDEDRKKLETLDSLIAFYTAEITKYTENSTFSINRQRLDSLALSYNMLENMLERLQTIDKSASIVKSSEFRNQSIENHFREGIQNINSVDTIRYSFNDEEKVKYVKYETKINNGFNIFQKKLDYVMEIGSQFEELVPFIAQSIKEIDQDDRIASLEDEMSKLLSHVDTLYAGNAEDEDYMIQELLNSVWKSFRRITDKTLQQYTESDDFEEKTKLGNGLLKDAEKMLDIHPKIAHTDVRLAELNEAYLVYTSNRFLEEHTIRTRVKRGIYSAGVEHLIPEILTQIKDSESLEEISSLSEKLDNSFKRLMAISELENSDTQMLDRKLRNVRDIDEIMELLEV